MDKMRPNVVECKPVLPGLLRSGSLNTVTDIAEKMHVDQERLKQFVRESSWEHENVETDLWEPFLKRSRATTLR